MAALVVALLAAAALFCAVGPAGGQTLATLQGRVLDPLGGLIAGAEIIETLIVDAGRTLVRDFRLSVGSISETVRVETEVPLVDRARATVSHVVTAPTIRQIPLNGRHFTDLGLLVPGSVSQTMHADANVAVEVLRAGAAGFVLKESSGEELLTALREVLAGRTYLAAGLTREIVTLMVGAADPDRVELTIRQREVLRLIVQGQRAKEIAGALQLSPRTVEAIKYKTMQLVNVHSTAELVRYAIEHRLVPL